MNLGPELVDAAVVLVIGVILAWVIRDRSRHQERQHAAQIATLRTDVVGQLATLRTDVVGQLATLRTDVVGQLATLRSDATGRIEVASGQVAAQRELMDVRFDAAERRFDSIDQQFASLRADLTQIALAVGAQPRPQAG
jgi:hypothetical protein